jgi:hypothetical protein
MLGKLILMLSYLLISIFLFATFSADTSVWISFFVSNLLLFGMFWWHLHQEKEFSPFISVFLVFSFLFFILSPVLQIGELNLANGVFITNLKYSQTAIVHTNVLVIIFNLTFAAAYLYFKKFRTLRVIPVYDQTKYKTLPILISIITIATVLVFIASFGFVQEEIRRHSGTPSSASIGMLLLWKKVLFMMPFAGIVLCFQYFKKRKKLPLNIVIVALLFLILGAFLLWFKNPLTEKRNALGPIYICIIFLIAPRLLNSNVKMTLFMFFSMIIVFPLSAMLTHVTATFKEILNKPRVLLDSLEGYGIGQVFNTLHYDAFINITATIDYVKYEGFSYGNQLLSGLLFFIPRSLWEAKPITTGKLVGEHLIEYHGFHYSNLSNPLVSEGYINLGIFGVVIIAIVLAITCIKFLSWFKSDDYLKKILALYFSIHLLFLLRGDFANGFSYYIGIFVGVYILTRFIQYIMEQMFLNQLSWKAKHKQRI